jgi:hypothetical protein
LFDPLVHLGSLRLLQGHQLEDASRPDTERDGTSDRSRYVAHLRVYPIAVFFGGADFNPPLPLWAPMSMEYRRRRKQLVGGLEMGDGRLDRPGRDQDAAKVFAGRGAFR